MIDERFIYLGVAINFYGTISYLKSTLAGKTKPNKVTWFLWGLAPLVAFVAQYTQGVGLISLMTFSIGFGPVLIFLASFVNKKSDWKITNFDIYCGLLSLLGLVLWGITKVGNVAILFAILADGLAAIPTLIKSYRFPETENLDSYLCAGISALIACLAIQNWNFATYAFPIWTVFLCAIFVLIIKFKLGKKI